MNTRLLFLHALSPLHAGTGQGVGVIDLPIAREKATNIPYVPGSTIKGVLRDASEATRQANTDKVFGPPTDNADAYAGSLVISDARLLLLPVRSLLGTFAWVTSPYLLHRLGRDLESGLPAPIPAFQAEESACYVAEKGSALLHNGKTVYLEDLDLTATLSADVTAWAAWLGQQLFSGDDAEHWRKQLNDRLCIVHDNVLAFLLDTATEVRARVKLDDKTKTVQSGGLWYEEALPAETVLAALAAAAPVRKHALTAADIFALVETLVARPQQLGGKATVGYGVCNLRLSAAQ
jgi:CRISPR-associated protein Cmr4